MLVGRVTGKITTSSFKFLIDFEVKKFDFVKVFHEEYGNLLCQIIDIERSKGEHVAICHILGYKDKDNLVKSPRSTIHPESDVFIADDSLIESIIKTDNEKSGAYIGNLDGKNIKVFLNMNKLLTKHVVVLAKSGAGKSYFVGVLLEEIIDKNIPLLVIDPHGEYSSLKEPNDKEKDILNKFNLKPKSFRKQVNEYGDEVIDSELIQLKLNNRMNLRELLEIVPVKLSNNQLAILYDTVKNVKDFNFSELCFALEQSESNVKWSVIGIIENIVNLGIFSESYTPLNELIRPGRCSIINLKGMAQTKQEILIYQLLHDLFEARKKNQVPPFFCVIEEAHNFCPERSFGETKASKVIRSIASEGRKFGLGLCVVSQRPARLDKSVISQCTTQAILKITNPNDLKTVMNSVEGITQESMSEIRNLPIGSAMICGVVDLPMFVNIRTRMTRHGGESVDMLSQNKTLIDQLDVFESENKIPLVKPNKTIKEFSKENHDENIIQELVPGVIFNCVLRGIEFRILAELVNGEIITDLDGMITAKLPNLDELNVTEIKVLGEAFKLEEFTAEEFILSTGKSLDYSIILKNLNKKGFLILDDDTYRINKKIILGSLNEYSFSGNVVLEKCDFNRVDAKVSIDTIRLQISKFTHVNDMTECFILKYSTK